MHLLRQKCLEVFLLPTTAEGAAVLIYFSKKSYKIVIFPQLFKF